MSHNASAQPPQLAGFQPVRYIGGGGYADVFVYEQQMPHRQVAVKVLKGEAVSGEARRRLFTAEANLMARVSTHPYIVTIFHADVAPDGRPFIVMEYYPGKNFLERARHERLTVADALRVSIQIGSAVETAHRAGILHRDLKPANILTSEFRRPGLTDFGIASTQGGDGNSGDSGVSIPWAPPEAFGDAELGVSADVYSLAATAYHLLAGRSPFEMPSGDNSPLALMRRIEHDPLQPIGRADVPAVLERVLAQGMAKAERHRPRSVVELLRQLQQVEAELHLAVTPLELADDGAIARDKSDPVDGDATRVRAVSEIRQPTSPVSPAPAAAAAPAAGPAAINSVPADPTGFSAPVFGRAREGMVSEASAEHTVVRGAAEAAPDARSESGTATGSHRLPLIVGAVLLVLVAVLGVIVAVGGGGSPSSAGDSVVESSVRGTVAAIQPVVMDEPSVNGDGSVVFSWTPTAVERADTFLLELTVNDASSGDPPPTQRRSFTTAPQLPGSRVCLVVTATRNGSQPAEGAEKCAVIP